MYKCAVGTCKEQVAVVEEAAAAGEEEEEERRQKDTRRDKDFDIVKRLLSQAQTCVRERVFARESVCV